MHQGRIQHFEKGGVPLKKMKNVGVNMGAWQSKFIGIWHSKFTRVVSEFEALP